MGLAALALNWWMYPMKPVLIGRNGLSELRLEDYTVERKYDGWRAIVIANGRTRLWTRQRRPIAIPDELQAALEALRLQPGTVLDGEIWNPSKRGGWADPEGNGCRLTLWDCVRDGTAYLGKEPLEARRRALEEAVGHGSDLVGLTEVSGASVAAVEAIEAEARAVRDGGDLRSGFIHGAVLKRRGSRRHDSPRRSAENASWLKVVFWP